MFGLPWETTLIMGISILFWILATYVFYIRTANWNSEDADYESPEEFTHLTRSMDGEEK